jgi:polyamine oxidase
MMAQAVEWWQFDWKYSYAPELSSALWAVINYNTAFYQYSAENNYVLGLPWLNAIIKGQASTFLSCTLGPNYDCSGDARLLLNTVVKEIAHNNTDVTITNRDGSYITASYAILNVSLGVLQNEVITFSPSLPDWKRSAIAKFQMATYTKDFLQFPPDKLFWTLTLSSAVTTLSGNHSTGPASCPVLPSSSRSWSTIRVLVSKFRMTRQLEGK